MDEMACSSCQCVSPDPLQGAPCHPHSPLAEEVDEASALMATLTHLRFHQACQDLTSRAVTAKAWLDRAESSQVSRVGHGSHATPPPLWPVQMMASRYQAKVGREALGYSRELTHPCLGKVCRQVPPNPAREAGAGPEQ